VLVISIPLAEDFDDDTGVYTVTESFELEFEHSLVSLSKWEAHYEKPFLNNEEKSAEETSFYIEKCMLLTKNPPGGIFQKFSKKHFDEIQEYIKAKRGAEWFHEPPGAPGRKSPSRQVITSKVIYGWLVALRIPFETQYWHLEELMTLVKVCNEQTKKPTKVGRQEALRQQAAINARRQAEMGTRG
jgi:hypothetical protein